MVDLNTLLTAEYSGWSIYDAQDVANNGWICGTAVGPDNRFHAYVLTPEPGTGLLVAIGAMAIRVRKVRRVRRV